MERQLASKHLSHARTLYDLRRYDLAIVAALDASALDPDDPTPLVVLANAHERFGHIREAETAATRAIALDPSLARGRTALGMVRLLQRRYADGLACFREAIRLAPHYGDAYRLAAHAEMVQGHYTRALELVDRALDLEPESIHALEVRAMVLRKWGRRGEAERATAEILRLDPENVLGLRQEGLLQLERGKRDDALAAFREALRLDPASEAARAGYERVVLRTSLVRHYRVVVFGVLIVALMTVSIVTDRPFDQVTFFELYLTGMLGRRAAFVEVLRRDEISRTFIDPAEIASNGASIAFALLATAAALVCDGTGEGALSVVSAGAIAAIVALRGAGLPGISRTLRLGFRRVALGAVASAAVAAAFVALGERYAPLAPFSAVLAIRLMAAASAAGLAFFGKREPAAARDLFRTIVPRRRER